MPTTASRAYRLPRRGDRVRFWELTWSGIRRRRTATVIQRRGRWVWLRDGDETLATPTREMEVLP